MTEWKHWTPEYDGHAPDDWDGLNVETDAFEGWLALKKPEWLATRNYRYRAKPDLLAQCLALPQADREALIEALQKPQMDWADDVWVQVHAAWQAIPFNNGSGEDDRAAAAVIRSMCRPKEETYSIKVDAS